MFRYGVTQVCWGEAAAWAEVELSHSSFSVRVRHMGSLKRWLSSPRWQGDQHTYTRVVAQSSKDSMLVGNVADQKEDRIKVKSILVTSPSTGI